MISTLIAGISIIILSGVANTYISHFLFGEIENPPEKNNL